MKRFLSKFLDDITHTLNVPDYGEPKAIIKQTKVIENKYHVQPMTPVIEDLDQLLIKVRALWHKDGINGFQLLKPREVKWLPWVLYHGKSPKIIEEKDILVDILKFLMQKWKVSLSKLIHVYIKCYDPNVLGTELIRKVIHSQLTSYKGKIYILNNWKKNLILFAPNGVNISADLLLNQMEDIEKLLIKLGLDRELAQSNFLRYVGIEIINKISKNNRLFNNNLDVVKPVLEYKVEHITRSLYGADRTVTKVILRFPELISEAASLLLPKAGYDATPQTQDILRPLFLKHLGDPRLPGGITKWSKVTKQAVAIFKQWLSKKDLEFFFNIVEKSNDDPKWIYRRKFWEAYLPHIENTWVVLGSKARTLVEKNMELKSHTKEYSYADFKGGSSGQSIFLIEMGGFVFVEWSNSGALRFWEKKDFPLKFGAKEYTAYQIRSHEPYDKINHTFSESYRWQDTLASWFRNDLGIKGVKSYILE